MEKSLLERLRGILPPTCKHCGERSDVGHTPSCEDYIARARGVATTDVLEIDDGEVQVSRSESGAWVQAWVWIQEEEA